MIYPSRYQMYSFSSFVLEILPSTVPHPLLRIWHLFAQVIQNLLEYFLDHLLMAYYRIVWVYISGICRT